MTLSVGDGFWLLVEQVKVRILCLTRFASPSIHCYVNPESFVYFPT